MMEFALKYAAEGFAVFPCRPRGKEPLGMLAPNGCLDATTDTETIRGWWTKCPDANIGLATGKKNGLVAVDLDGLPGITSGATLGISSIITSLTGNGLQLFYADPEGKLKNSVKKLAPGVDIRGEGGYCVVPPSVHPNGKRYTWRSGSISRNLLRPFPTSLLEEKYFASQVSTVLKTKAPNWIDEAIAKLREGHVHNTLISVLGKFRTANFSEEATYTLLKPHALENGLPYEGLRDKIAEIWERYQPGSILQSSSHSESIDAFLNDVKEVEWICKPFIAKKSIGFVAGLPETLKTWLCADLAVESAVENGLWLGLFPLAKCKTLFIDQERSRDETQRRFGSILASKGIHNSTLKDKLYLKSGTTIRLNLDTSYQAFRSELQQMRPDLVIVDSFKAFHTVTENDSTEIQKVIERIKELRNEFGCTFVFIHHENKHAYPNGEPQGEPHMGTMTGSIAIGAAAEFCLIVRKMEDNTSMVWHAKSTQAKKAKPFYASVVDVPEGIVVRGIND